MATSDVHLTLDSNVRVRHRRGEELAKGTEEEGHCGRDLSSLFDIVLHLLEERILKNGVDDQDQRRQDAGEESLGTLVLKEGHQRAQGCGLPGRLARLQVGLGVLLARGDASVDNPDGVGDNDGGRAGDGASNHGLNSGELLAGATSRGGGLLEEGPGPLIPVVVDKVGDADAKERRVDARIQSGNPLARDNLLDSVDELALGLFGLDLSAGGEGNERIAVGRKSQVSIPARIQLVNV